MAARLLPGVIGDVPAQITQNIPVAPGFYAMSLSVPGAGEAFAPGQFFELSIPDGGVFLRRPFAPSHIRPQGFSFVYAVVGTGTSCMQSLPSGARLSVLGPLGRGWTLPPAGARVLLLGGGCGAPSLAPLAAALSGAASVTAVVGARTASALLGADLLAGAGAEVRTATDDGSAGTHGTVLDAAADCCRDCTHIYACGPTPMLRAAARFAAQAGIKCEVSLEQRMACGFGACMGCVVPVLPGPAFRRVCKDGPVFSAESIDWDTLR